MGKFPVIMDLHWSTVDVRDVAKAHILAMESEKSGRYICGNEQVHLIDLCKILRKHFPQYQVPTTDMSGWLGSKFMYVASFGQPKGVGTYIQTNLGKRYSLDTSKIKKDLGIEFMPLEQTLVDTVNFFIETKLLTEKKK